MGRQPGSGSAGGRGRWEHDDRSQAPVPPLGHGQQPARAVQHPERPSKAGSGPVGPSSSRPLRASSAAAPSSTVTAG